jgi:hypothetical protein
MRATATQAAMYSCRGGFIAATIGKKATHRHRTPSEPRGRFYIQHLSPSMSDAVQLALIGMISSIIAMVGTIVVAYFQHGQKKAATETRETVRKHAEISRDTNAVVTETKGKVEAVHEQTNGRLLRAEAALAYMVAERDRLLAEIEGRRKED